MAGGGGGGGGDETRRYQFMGKVTTISQVLQIQSFLTLRYKTILFYGRVLDQ